MKISPTAFIVIAIACGLAYYAGNNQVECWKSGGVSRMDYLGMTCQK